MNNAKEMCDTCIHKKYCLLAYKKDFWCGNHISIYGNKFNNGELIKRILTIKKY